ncbi:very-long-chain (3R)-3-hydroxyacyl-CoA dehydratase 2 [Impatiens glandulifera]|uniref:very-long-chain (3R)-3-hydroxyacyl-CoA dehydratase 2 n=1 Tax=Impatiens glandulifera TaxID=253017 RepID=UPI001FB17B95|nr:very-long-chain (3R)-3-hydroxyacyl-CoA dehydratase 2 [Impatiens glandulifera]
MSGSLSNLYLAGYNSLQAAGWTISLLKILNNFITAKSFNGAYASAGDQLCFLQAFAFLEVIHGAIGIVPSGWVNPLFQWAGRSNFLLLIVRPIYEVQELPAVYLTLIAWCLIEVVRYPYYAFTCIGDCPYLITYLRYTAFIVLYPVGMIAEMWLMYQALPYIKDKSLYADSFKSLHFSYCDLVKVILLVYPLVFPKLYLHLFRQRKAKLFGKTHEKKKRR